jgi:hypothetical protein
MLAGEPADAVDLQGPRQVFLAIRRTPLRVAAEDVVAAERDQPDVRFPARRRQIAHRGAVDAERLLGLLLAQRHVVEGSAVDDELRPVLLDRLAYLLGPDDIELRALRRNDLVACPVAQQISAELSGSPYEENLHAFSTKGLKARSRSDITGSASGHSMRNAGSFQRRPRAASG